MNKAIRPPTAIIFDFGGVLIDWDPRYLYRKFFDGDAAGMERFLAEVGFYEWNLQQDAGRTFAEAVPELSGRFPHYAELIRAYDERYLESIAGAIRPSLEIVAALKQAGYPLYGLSNWPLEKYLIARQKYAFFGWFDDVLVSGEAKLVKPDPRIFRMLLERIGRTAAECVYIDDSRTNVSAACQLGFDAIHFQSAPQLEMELKQRGLL
jgi:2-haloacid dehalogenase